MSEDPSQEYEAVGDPSEDIGDEDAQIAARWIAELQAARKGPYKRWLQRSKRAVKRYRDEDMDNDEAGVGRRNAQFNVLWSNVNTVAPSVYSRGPKPVAERRYLDRDTLARAGATILQRSLTYAIEDSGLHETMMQCRTDLFLVGMGSAWLRYQAQYDKAAPQHQEQPADGAPAKDDDKPEYSAEDGQPQAYGARDRVKHQKICVDYCHWSDELFSPARFWSEITWRAKRAYYTRKQLARTFPKLTKEQIASIPLKAQRGRKQNDVTDQVREVVGKAEVWQIWDFEDREIIWICEDWAVMPLKRIEDQLNLSCFTPAARPVRATTTNDSIWPIPDYAIWHDQAGELDSLTARIAALTRAIKVVGVFDGSQAEIARLLDEGMENKLIAVKNWAKLVQRGGLEGSMYLLPIRDMAETLMGLYNARAQVKNDLYEISGVSDVVRGASDPNETAAAQKMKGQFSAVRGSDRKNEFNRFVRDTLVIMAEVMLEHYTDDMLWEMSDFEQWAKDQDLRAYAPMMGHNGGPPLDDPTQPMAQMPPLQGAYPAAAPIAPGASASPVAPPLSVDQTPAQAPVPPMIQQQAAAMPPGSMGGPAPMASSPGTPPVPGLQMPPGAQPPMPQPPAPKPPTNPPGADRELFNRALELLRDDKLRSFRIQVETNSTIEPDATQDQQARVEFLGAVTTFLAQAREMAVAYPQMMPVMGKMLLFGARGFPVGRELESSLEGLIADLEQMAKNPPPKPPSPEEVKAQTAREQGAMKLDQMKLQAQQQQEAFKLELQKMQAEMQALREKLEIEREKMMMEMQAVQQKLNMERERGAIKLQQDAQAGAIKTRQMHEQAAIDSEGMERQAQHDERMLGRKEQHEETKMELAVEAAKQKATAASVPSAGRKAPGNGKGAS